MCAAMLRTVPLPHKEPLLIGIASVFLSLSKPLSLCICLFRIFHINELHSMLPFMSDFSFCITLLIFIHVAAGTHMSFIFKGE